MPYNPNLALTNQQLRNQGLRGALDDFLNYFATTRKNKDYNDRMAEQKDIADKSAALGTLQAQAQPLQGATQKAQDVASIQAQTNPQNGFSLLNPAINPADVQAKAAQEQSLNTDIGNSRRALAQAKANYATKYNPDGKTFAPEDFLSEQDLQKEHVAQAQQQTQALQLGNQLNAGLLQPRLASAQTGAAKEALDLSTAQQTQPALVANTNLQPTATQAEIGLKNAQANKANIESSNGGLLPKDKMRLENNFRVQWDGENKAYESQAQGFMNMMGAGQKKTGASDQALLDSFVQTITGSKRPTHSQYEIALKSYGLDDLFNKWSAGAQGQWLTDNQRQNLKDVAVDEMKNIHARHIALKTEKTNELINSHGDPSNVFPSAQYEDQVGKYLTDGAAPGGLSDDDIIKQALGKK